ncbi:hypothetical protein D3C80_1776010 [compost metagenome]
MLFQKGLLRGRCLGLAHQLDPERPGNDGRRQRDDEAVDDDLAHIGAQHAGDRHGRGMRRQHAMHGHQGHGQGHAQVHEVDPRLFRHDIDQRNEQHEAHLEEHRYAGDEADKHHGP